MANPPTANEFLIGKAASPTVVLRHDLPDGSHHFDWMIAPDPDAKLPLITFRLERPLIELNPGESMRAERIADHRPAYLFYEGAVQGDRGQVQRVQSGTIRLSAASQSMIEIEWSGSHERAPVRQTLQIRGAKLPFCEVFCVGKTG